MSVDEVDMRSSLSVVLKRNCSTGSSKRISSTGNTLHLEGPFTSSRFEMTRPESSEETIYLPECDQFNTMTELLDAWLYTLRILLPSKASWIVIVPSSRPQQKYLPSASGTRAVMET